MAEAGESEVGGGRAGFGGVRRWGGRLGLCVRRLFQGALRRYGGGPGVLFRTGLVVYGRRPFLVRDPRRRRSDVGGRGVRCGAVGLGGVLGGEVGVPPLVVVGGAGPEGAEHPSGLVACADRAADASQVPGHGQGGQGAADGLLAVERELFGQLLHTHRRTLGEMVDEPGNVPLTYREKAEVVRRAGPLVGRGALPYPGLAIGYEVDRAGARRAGLGCWVATGSPFTASILRSDPGLVLPTPCRGRLVLVVLEP